MSEKHRIYPGEIRNRIIMMIELNSVEGSTIAEVTKKKKDLKRYAKPQTPRNEERRESRVICRQKRLNENNLTLILI